MTSALPSGGSCGSLGLPESEHAASQVSEIAAKRVRVMVTSSERYARRLVRKLRTFWIDSCVPCNDRAMDRAARLTELWSWLPAFRAVAETQHLPTAAAALHVS